MIRLGPVALTLALLALLASSAARAQELCANRGQLDDRFCDDNEDLVADPPKNPAKQRDPATLIFAYTPVEDPAVYENIFRPFTNYLAQCTGKRVVYYPVQSNSAEVEAMRSGRLHVAGFSPGPTGFAVNMAGAVPFAAKGTEQTVEGYQLIFIVRKDSPYHKLGDLNARRIAHTSPSSNSGILAPQVPFSEQCLRPGHDMSRLSPAATIRRRSAFATAPMTADRLPPTYSNA
jgi:phosphonate transport system substrate-binding protein